MINYVFHVWYQLFDGIVYVISVITTQYMTAYIEVCYQVNRLGIVFCAPKNKLLPATIYSSEYLLIMLMLETLNQYHDTKESFCVIHFQFFYMPISAHYNIQSIKRNTMK